MITKFYFILSSCSAMFEKRFLNDFQDDQSPGDRRRFVIKVYIQFVLFVLLGVLHFVLAVTILKSTCVQLIEYYGTAFVMLFIISIFLFVLYALIDQISEIPLLGSLIVCMIVECLNLALILLVAKSNPLYLMISILVVVTMVLILCILGTFMPFDITNSVSFFICIACCVFLLSIYGIVYYVTLKTTWPIFFFIGIIASLVLCFLMYHVQCIAGYGHVQAGLGDDKYAALLLYHDFLALFMLTVYWQ